MLKPNIFYWGQKCGAWRHNLVEAWRSSERGGDNFVGLGEYSLYQEACWAHGGLASRPSSLSPSYRGPYQT